MPRSRFVTLEEAIDDYRVIPIAPAIESAVLELLAGVIREADTISQGQWGLTRFEDEGFRLNVGWTEVMTCSPDGLRVIAVKKLIPLTKLAKNVVVEDGGRSEGIYKSIPGSVEVTVPVSSATAVKVAFGHVQPALKESMRLAAMRSAGQGVRDGHDQDLVDEIAASGSDPLPRPAYLTPKKRKTSTRYSGNNPSTQPIGESRLSEDNSRRETVRKRVFVPTTSPLDWKRLLAQPDRHWKPGYSAMSLARSWEAAGDKLPPEIAALLATSTHTSFQSPRLLLAVPEHTMDLVGGQRPTQTDVFALVRGQGGLAVLAIEGKVAENFGPTVEQKRAQGAAERLDYLHQLLGLDAKTTGLLRYQLLHRTAAALLLAHDYCASTAAMIVHSFSPDHDWFEDFTRFSAAMGGDAQRGQLLDVRVRDGISLFLGWATGDQQYRGDVEIVVAKRGNRG